MSRLSCVLALILTLCAQIAAALSVGSEDSTSPFTIDYQSNLAPSVAVTLQVLNDASEVQIFAWQLQLEMRPSAGSVGTLLFQNVSAPPDSLFGQDPGPVSSLTSPSNYVTVFDSENDPNDADGETLPSGSARNIMQATLVASQDGAGDFQLVLRKFDAMNEDNSSSWLPADSSGPTAFDNAADSDFVLGTISVRQSAPGDYDHDGVVGPLDYGLWRSHFGDSVSVPGQDADGNKNSIIDAADYVIWRMSLNSLGTRNKGDESRAIVAEPVQSVVEILGIAIGALCRSSLVLAGRSLNRKPAP